MSGNRLPGDEEGNDRHKTEFRAAARLNGELADRLEHYCEQNGETKSDVVREALDEFLPMWDLPDYVVPKDPDLADAYRTLAREGEKRVLSVEKALDIISRQALPNTDKELILDDVLGALDDGGLVGIKNGNVAVHPLTPIDEVDGVTDSSEVFAEVEEDATADLDSLAKGTPARTDGGQR